MQISRQELLYALEAVRPGLANKEIVEQSTSFVFQNGRVYTYNDQIAVSHDAPGEIIGAVKANEIYSLLKRMTGDEIEIAVVESELRVSKKNKIKAGIPLIAEVSLPVDEISKKKEWQELPEGFINALRFVLFSAGNDMTRPELTAVHMTEDHLETCDNFRLTQYTFTSGVDIPLLIPAAAASSLIKYIPTHIAVDTDGQWVHFKNTLSTEFSCRLISGTFPLLTGFIDRPAGYTIDFPDNATEILDRAQVFLDDDQSSSRYVKIIVAAGYMTVKASGAAGWFEERVRVSFKGEGVEFMVSPQFLRDMLGEVSEVTLDADRSVLKFVGPNFIHCCAVVESEATA